MSETDSAPKPSYRPISGIAESLAAIEEVMGAAQRAIRVFDISLSNRGFNSPGLTEKLRQFVVAGRAHRIFIALHNTELLERESPRLLGLLRQFPMSIEIHRTLAQARNAMDPFVWPTTTASGTNTTTSSRARSWRCTRPPTPRRSCSASTRSGSCPSPPSGPRPSGCKARAIPARIAALANYKGMRSMKQIHLLVAVVALGIAACGKEAPTPAPTPKPKTEAKVPMPAAAPMAAPASSAQDAKTAEPKK